MSLAKIISLAFHHGIFGNYLRGLLVPGHLFLVFGDATIELYYLFLRKVDLLGDPLVSPGLGNHILLNSFLVVHIGPGHFIQLSLFDCQLLAYLLIVSFLVVDFVHVDALAILLQVG